MNSEKNGQTNSILPACGEQTSTLPPCGGVKKASCFFGGGYLRLFTLLLTLALFTLAEAVSLNIFIEHNRFLDSEGNTIHHFNYKVPNNELSFAEAPEGFLAQLNVAISRDNQAGEKVPLKEFTRSIGVRSREAALSTANYYLDKVTLTLTGADFSFYLDFKDNLSGREFHWSKKLENIKPSALLSDLELASSIVRNKPQPGMENFLRGNYQFYLDPTHIYNRSVQDTLFLYYEIQNLFPAADEYSYFSENIFIRNDSDTLKIDKNVRGKMSAFDRIHRIPLQKLSDGYYLIDVAVEDAVSGRQETASNYFVIAQRTVHTYRLFHDTAREHQLLRYFLPSAYFSDWNRMSDTAKANLIDRFWRQNNPNPQSDANEFLQNVRERISYANRNFSHSTEGWETDRGRVYIRNGEPSEIEKNYVGGDIRLTRREYQIWRYRNLNRTYLFIDVQGTGNFRLIYSKNDEMELTAHDWERFVGEDFDQNLLQQ